VRQGALHLSPSLAGCGRLRGACLACARCGPSGGRRFWWGAALGSEFRLEARMGQSIDGPPAASAAPVPFGGRHSVKPLPDTALCIRQCQTDGRVPYTRETGSSLGRPSDKSPHFRADHLVEPAHLESLSPLERCLRPTYRSTECLMSSAWHRAPNFLGRFGGVVGASPLFYWEKFI
jgi:hypothetical protein